MPKIFFTFTELETSLQMTEQRKKSLKLNNLEFVYNITFLKQVNEAEFDRYNRVKNLIRDGKHNDWSKYVFVNFITEELLPISTSIKYYICDFIDERNIEILNLDIVNVENCPRHLSVEKNLNDHFIVYLQFRSVNMNIKRRVLNSTTLDLGSDFEDDDNINNMNDPVNISMSHIFNTIIPSNIDCTILPSYNFISCMYTHVRYNRSNIRRIIENLQSNKTECIFFPYSQYLWLKTLKALLHEQVFLKLYTQCTENYEALKLSPNFQCNASLQSSTIAKSYSNVAKIFSQIKSPTHILNFLTFDYNNVFVSVTQSSSINLESFITSSTAFTYTNSPISLILDYSGLNSDFFM